MNDTARGAANNRTNTTRFYHLFSLVLVFLCQALFLFHYVHFIQVFSSGHQHSISRILFVSKPFTDRRGSLSVYLVIWDVLASRHLS